MRGAYHSRSWAWAGAALVAAGLAVPVFGQDPDDLRRGVARISLIDGEVSVLRGDSGEWVAASPNAPLLTNDRVTTGPNSRVEVQFDNANLLRLGGDADVTFSQLEADRVQIGLASGTASFRVLRSSNSDREVDTPSVSVRPFRVGTYRISIDRAGETEVTVRSGEVEVFTPDGSEWVRAGQTMQARGSASDPEFQIVRAFAEDDWDRWNETRDQALTRSASYRYVGPGIYGVEDLDPYGTWVNVAPYGSVWQPAAAVGWAPYRVGRWVWADWYGWTWVSDEPWGWAPYHYGRWFYAPARGWCWYPGIVGVRHYWAPGLVAFVGFGGGGVSVGFANVGWVPLAPYEVLHPWWGRGSYGSGPFLNRSINVVNVNVTNVYQNSRITNGFTAVSGTDFRSGRFTHFVRPSGDQLRQGGLMRGPLPVAPERENLRFTDRQAVSARPAGTTRFFTHQPPAPVASVPFAEQRRAFERGGQPGAPPAGATRSRFGAPAAPPPAVQAPVIRNESGRQRPGNAPGATVTPRNQPAPPAAAPRGWTRFGAPSEKRPPEGARPQRPERSEPRSEARTQNRDNRNAPPPGESFRPAPPPPRAAPNRAEPPPAGARGGAAGNRGNNQNQRATPNRSGVRER